jgi:hypothetical protein
MQPVNRAVDDKILVRKLTVTLTQELECEIEMTPTPQFTRVQIAASQVAVFRLRRGKHVGLVFRLKDEEPLAVLVQKIQHPFFEFL